MSNIIIPIWVEWSTWKNIAENLKCQKDSEEFYVALNSYSTLQIKPITRKIFEAYGYGHGAIKIEIWKEGLVLWVGGEIVWKSWEQNCEKDNNESKSEVPNIPVGFTFNWSERNEINDFFTEIEKQGFKVVKNEP